MQFYPGYKINTNMVDHKTKKVHWFHLIKWEIIFKEWTETENTTITESKMKLNKKR